MPGVGRSNALRGVCTIVGASCFLAMRVYELTCGGLAITLDHYDFEEACFLITAVLILFCSRAMQSAQRRRIMLEVEMCVAVVYVVLVTIAALDAQAEASALLGALAAGFEGIFSVVMLASWNVAIVKCNGDKVIGVVAGITLLVPLFICGIALFAIPQSVSASCFTLVSAALCLCVNSLDGKLEESDEKQSSQDDDTLPGSDYHKASSSRRYRLSFFGLRVVWGIVFGIAYSLAVNTSAHIPLTFNLRTVAVVVFISLGALYFIYLLQTRKSIPIYLIVGLPFIPAVSLIVIAGGWSACLLCAISYFVWQIQTYAQIQMYSRLTQMPPVYFSYLEKGVAMVTFAVVSIVMPDISMRFGYPSAHAIETLSMVLSVALVIVSVVLLCRLAMMKLSSLQKNKWSEFSLEPVNDVFRETVSKLSSEYALTNRERDVFLLLARGYSRKAIENRLYISTGTTRSHMRHIYAKLGVTSQDMLIALVESSVSTPEE